jgi:hypothetical protein
MVHKVESCNRPGDLAGVLNAITRIAQSSWQGWLAHAMLLDRVATLAEIAEAYALG